jgi:hypothetical protein
MSTKREVVGKGMDALFSGARKPESGMKSSDSRQQTPESGESRLEVSEVEQSADSGVQKEEARNQTSESRVQTPDSEGQRAEINTQIESRLQSSESGLQTTDSEEQSIDTRVLEEAIAEAKAYPKCSIWSPLVMAVFRYRQLTTVRYKMSAEACDLLEKAVEERYPELCKEIRGKTNQGQDNK